MTNMNANDLFNAVMQLDLEPIKTKLMHVESGEGWSPDKANAVEKEYRRFLCLMKMYPDEPIAPLVDVDTFWHYHILDTMKYAADCEQAFGYFLHHYPYVGMGDEDDEQFRIDSGERMQSLYEATFGDAYPVTDATPVEAVGTAYCAGPWDQPKARGAEPIRIAAAYCAGPWDKHAGTAYCAGPWDKPHAHAAARTATAAAATAYCAGPWDKHGTTAYCAGPWDRKDARAAAGAATAYCAGPWKPNAAPAALDV
jgi:hypothetical protein